MTAIRRPLAVGTALALALGLAACTTTPDSPAPTSPVVQLGAPGEPNHTLSPDEAAGSIDAPEHTELDADFMRDMIHHHDQAIEMTALVEERTDDRDIRLLAERMSASQQDERTLMVSWLQDRGVPVNDQGHDAHASGGAAMPGMLSDEQMAELGGADGDAFDQLFLVFMIQHHEGAVQMVDELYAAGGGQESATDQFARHVESDQGIEIARMQQMLAERAG
ncbi:DUF305 domain-containing protein [Agromyces sp. NPDC057679]|uniref:DUF305 domain-containing protein n=1 Tax=Agromyces sp. NPDC057679 TaxID=3346207 RepID=UPI003670BAC1